ncbi:uncharacterized protein LOC110740627 [Papio anubis]|uniref:uncharacterized protein LOC110740627 n=1 Tax=Papio anubis TaxID=9555 RepID=UPI0012AEA35A|nr:uncharacterized protein LOC110740627 [Papio anubis]
MGAQGEGGSGVDWRDARRAGRQQDESRLGSGGLRCKESAQLTRPLAGAGRRQAGDGPCGGLGAREHRPAGAEALQARRQEALSQPSAPWRRGPKGGAFLKRRRPLQEAKGMAAWAAVDQGAGPRVAEAHPRRAPGRGSGTGWPREPSREDRTRRSLGPEPADPAGSLPALPRTRRPRTREPPAHLATHPPVGDDHSGTPGLPRGPPARASSRPVRGCRAISAAGRRRTRRGGSWPWRSQGGRLCARPLLGPPVPEPLAGANPGLETRSSGASRMRLPGGRLAWVGVPKPRPYLCFMLQCPSALASQWPVRAALSHRPGVSGDTDLAKQPRMNSPAMDAASRHG